MKRRVVWLEVGILIVTIALGGAWMRPRVEEKPAVTGTPSPRGQPLSVPGLRFLGNNTKGFEEYENTRDGSVLIKIPGGTFTMGSNNGSDNEKPPHKVTLPPYLIARVPVTNAQFAHFVSATGHDAGSRWKEYASRWGDRAAVVCVNWNDATAYCTWAGLRLPTEEEWELAARGTEGYEYPWGNDWDASRCKNSVGTMAAGPAPPVGSFPSGASPFGCLDMVGSVWQLTSSWYDRYPGNTTSDNSFGQEERVLRGGSWVTGDVPSNFRGAFRGGNGPVCRDYLGGGLRVARNAP